MGALGEQWFAASGAYEINYSCRFNDGDSPELSRTYTLNAPWTFSAWVKRGELGSENMLLGASGGEIHFNSNDTLESEGTSSTAVFRDPAAWYHIHVSNNGQFVNGVSHGAVTTTNLSNTKLFDDFDGYVAEVHLLSGTSAVTNFGETNDAGVWIPKQVSGGDTLLKFADSSDFGVNTGSGDAWTASNLASTDQMTDTPTDNYCVWNSIDAGSGTLSDGNLVLASTTDRSGTIGMTSGKWAWKLTTAASGAFGVVQGSLVGTESTYSAGSGEVLEFEFDIDSGTLEVSVDGGSYSSVATGLTSGPYFPLAKAACTADFGQSGFTKDDSTFNYVSTNSLAAPTIEDPSAYFQTQTYTGNGTAIGSGGKAVTFGGNSDLEPDLVWIKNVDGTDSHNVYDSGRGTTKLIETNVADAESTETEGLTTFGSDGFTVGNLEAVNTNTENYVAWAWKESTDSDFDIVTYTGNGSARTISHSVGAVPNVIIVKNRAAGDPWKVYHSEVASDAETDYLILNERNGAQDLNTIWNDTAPTSSVFSVGTHDDVNTNTETYVAYLWSEVEAFSKFGNYTGNGNAAGPFVYCGFKPRFTIIKSAESTESWCLYDSKRPGYNSGTTTGAFSMFADGNGVDRAGTNENIDILSNGFKIKGDNDAINTDGTKYAFMAWAENPFGGSSVSPVTAS
jgi:hypothetical protein